MSDGKHLAVSVPRVPTGPDEGVNVSVGPLAQPGLTVGAVVLGEVVVVGAVVDGTVSLTGVHVATVPVGHVVVGECGSGPAIPQSCVGGTEVDELVTAAPPTCSAEMLEPQPPMVATSTAHAASLRTPTCRIATTSGT